MAPWFSISKFPLSWFFLGSISLGFLSNLEAAVAERDLLIVAGQSNSVGFDAAARLLEPEAMDREAWFWFRCGDPPPDDHDTTGGNQWGPLRAQPLGNPAPRDSKTRQYGNYSDASGGFGPEIGLARTLMTRQPERALAVLKVAFSGTDMERDWNRTGPGGACWKALLEEWEHARDAAKAQGVTLRPRAFVWIQGESDAQPERVPHYADRLGGMILALRQRLDAPGMPALLAVNTRFLDGSPELDRVIAAQRFLGKQLHRCAYVDTSKATVANRVHFDAAGTLQVGVWMGESLLEMESSPSK